MAQEFTVIIEEGEDGYYISEVVELPGCHTQAKTKEELLKRTKEAIKLYLSVTEEKNDEFVTQKFIGVEKVVV